MAYIVLFVTCGEDSQAQPSRLGFKPSGGGGALLENYSGFRRREVLLYLLGFPLEGTGLPIGTGEWWPGGLFISGFPHG